VVSVLATGTKVCGFKPGLERRDFKGDKNPCTTFFGGEVKLSIPCRKIIWHVKVPYEHERDNL
jgi:hypothetical protein